MTDTSSISTSDMDDATNLSGSDMLTPSSMSTVSVTESGLNRDETQESDNDGNENGVENGVEVDSGVASNANGPQKKKKRKKAKKSNKAKDTASAGSKSNTAEQRPAVLCISRNKHWRYISSYHVSNRCRFDNSCSLIRVQGTVASTASRTTRVTSRPEP